MIKRRRIATMCHAVSKFNVPDFAHQAMGFSARYPVDPAIPPGLEGRDVLGSAQTGSGKTVAFGLPLLNKLLQSKAHDRPGSKPIVRALIMVPTRELAAQVETCIRDLARFSPVQVALIIGGVSFHNQVQALRKGAEIVVATPGRLLDHYRQRTLELKHAQTVVLDEADRMLDMGFMPDVRRIMQLLPRERQTLMFSATIPPEVERVVREFMSDPEGFKSTGPRPRPPVSRRCLSRGYRAKV